MEENNENNNVTESNENNKANENNDYKNAERTFIINLLNYINNHGYKKKDIAKILGVSAVSVSRYFTGERTPHGENLIKLFQYFDISDEEIEMFRNNKEIKYIKSIERKSKTKRSFCLEDLIYDISNLSNEHIFKIIDMVETYKKIEEYEKKDKIKEKIRIIIK